jgi:hypothetical protein
MTFYRLINEKELIWGITQAWKIMYFNVNLCIRNMDKDAKNTSQIPAPVLGAVKQWTRQENTARE